MTVKEIIDGLKFTVDMFMFDPTTGKTYTEPRNDMDKTTIDACKGAIELLEQTGWIPVSERLPEEHKEVLTCGLGGYIEIQSFEDSYDGYWENQKGDWSDLDEVIAWMPLPEPYKAESEDKE